jgi:hypothetical protein
MRVTQHAGPPPPVTPRASLKAQQPQQQVKNSPVQEQVQKRFHWLFSVGVVMVAAIVLSIAASALAQWWHVQQDTWSYGTPRTFQIDANVGHDGISHFIVVNLHGHIIITEMHENNLAETKIYSGPVFSGNNVDDLVATISFQDVNGDGKSDMVISVQNGRYVLINTGSAFRPSTQADKISNQEVK